MAKMSVEDIAKDQGLQLVAVKSALMQCSKQYRLDCGREDETDDDLNFSEFEHKEVKRRLFELATTTEDQHLAGKLLMFIRDDAKGRRDAVKDMSHQTFNILQFNEAIQQNRDRVRAIKEKVLEA